MIQNLKVRLRCWWIGVRIRQLQQECDELAVKLALANDALLDFSETLLRMRVLEKP